MRASFMTYTVSSPNNISDAVQNGWVQSINRWLVRNVGQAVTVTIALVAISRLVNKLAENRIDPSRKILNITKNVAALFALATFAGIAVKWRHIPHYLFTALLMSKIMPRANVQWGMDRSPYEPRVCRRGNQIIGEISIVQNAKGHKIPVVKFHTKDPYEMGFAQGLLLGDKIEDLYYRVICPMNYLLRYLSGDWSGQKLNDQLGRLTIPENYKQEFQGLFDGVSAYAKKNNYQTKLTLRNVYEVHCLADSYKEIGNHRIFFGLFQPTTFGCSTVLVSRYGRKGIARTLDWPGFGLVGPYVYLREHQVGRRIVRTQTFPGYVGALTGRNSDGLVVVVNELGKRNGKGIPYGLFARYLLENAKNIQKAKQLIDSKKYQPASSHHLTMMDKQGGCNFQFLLNGKDYYFHRILPFHGYLLVTNHGLYANGNEIEDSHADATTGRRYRSMERVMQKEFESPSSNLSKLLRSCVLSATIFNTVAASMYVNEIEDHAFDSYYAASHLY